MRGRPAGEVGLAMLSAVAQGGPGTVRDLAERACVGYAAARYTASRLVSRGALVALSAGRPAVLAPAGGAGAVAVDDPAPVDDALQRLRSFWECRAGDDLDDDASLG